MAIDVIPDPTSELTEVLFVHKRLNEIKTEIDEKRDELEILENLQRKHTDIDINWEIASLRCRLDVLRTQYSIFQRIADQLPSLCGMCRGSRHGGSGMGAYCCSGCEGTGLAKSKLKERIPGSS